MHKDGSELTAIDIRHIEHSDEWEEAVSESFFVVVFPRSRSCLWVFTLCRCQPAISEGLCRPIAHL